MVDGEPVAAAKHDELGELVHGRFAARRNWRHHSLLHVPDPDVGSLLGGRPAEGIRSDGDPGACIGSIPVLAHLDLGSPVPSGPSHHIKSICRTQATDVVLPEPWQFLDSAGIVPRLGQCRFGCP